LPATIYDTTHRAINRVPRHETYSHPFLVHYFQFLHNAFGQVTGRVQKENKLFPEKGPSVENIV